MRTSLALGVASLAAVLAGMPVKAVADGPPEYNVTDLGTLPGASSSYAYGINASGQIVGTSGGNAFIYSNGSMTNLGAGAAYGINAAGQAVGEANVFSLTQAVLYSDGGVTNLMPFGNGTAYGINNEGQAVGSAGSGEGRTIGFLYSNGTLTSLAPVGSAVCSASAVNDAGQVVGYADGGGTQTAGRRPILHGHGQSCFRVYCGYNVRLEQPDSRQQWMDAGICESG